MICFLTSGRLIVKQRSKVVHVVKANVLAGAYARIFAGHSVLHSGTLYSVGFLLSGTRALSGIFTVKRSPFWTSILKRDHVAVLVYFLWN
jgi:hypothetical protein